MYLSDKTSEAIDVLVGMAFDLNRTFDRAVSYMNNTWCMPQASEIIHIRLAHLFPLLADQLTEFKDKCNLASTYPATHGDSRTYDNLLTMMETLLEEVGNFYEATKMTYGIAQDEGDLNACAMLYEFVNKIMVVVAQVITLRDKAEQMPTDYVTYDQYISSWGISGVEL